MIEATFKYLSLLMSTTNTVVDLFDLSDLL